MPCLYPLMSAGKIKSMLFERVTRRYKLADSPTNSSANSQIRGIMKHTFTQCQLPDGRLKWTQQ